MNLPASQNKHKYDWQKSVAKYQTPQRVKSIWQLVNTLVPYAALWYLMIRALAVSYWLVLPMALIAAGLLVRTFIIFHDCGHGSFFRSTKANNFWGHLTGVLIFTPYHFWRHQHAIHHAHSGNLDRRGVGEVWTLTKEEYRRASRWTKLKYRFIRNPFFLFVIWPIVLFLLVQRIPLENPPRRERRSVHLNNLGILLTVVLLSYFVGLKTYLIIQLPILMVTASTGVWLFYVQHQFEGVYWERSAKWDYVDQALVGSSFYKLPKILQWFTGNIGFHHVHHLSSRIPNYLLEKCYKENMIFQRIKPITLLSSLKSLKFRLWDERHKKLVGFDALKNIMKYPAA